LLIPLVMLNACLTFSWPNKVPFDRELEALFGPGSTWVCVLVLKGYNGDVKSEPKVRPSYRAVPGYCGSSLSHDIYLDSVIGDL
jgi:hypothetical protein